MGNRRFHTTTTTTNATTNSQIKIQFRQLHLIETTSFSSHLTLRLAFSRLWIDELKSMGMGMGMGMGQLGHQIKVWVTRKRKRKRKGKGKRDGTHHKKK